MSPKKALEYVHWMHRASCVGMWMDLPNLQMYISGEVSKSPNLKAYKLMFVNACVRMSVFLLRTREDSEFGLIGHLGLQVLCQFIQEFKGV